MVLLRAAAATFLVLTAGRALATAPPADRIWYHTRAGTLHLAGKGGIELPPSAKLRAMTIADTCSARGGPRGVYKYAEGKIWLVGLHGCRGGIGLHEVYPNVRTPPVASWVNGILVARLGKLLCASADGAPVHEAVVRMTVRNGAVSALEESMGTLQSCPSRSGGQAN